MSTRIRTIFSLITIFVIIATIGVIGNNINYNLNGFPSDSPVGEYTFEVKQGDTLSDFGTQFANKRVVNSVTGFDWQLRLNNTQPLQSGMYTLELPATIIDILTQIDEQTIQKNEAIAALGTKVATNITFREGIMMDEIIDLLVNKNIVDRQEFIDYLNNPLNFNREVYAFLPDPLDCTYGNPSQCAHFYPEGYFYPDTYSFFEDSTPEEVAAKFLNNFQNRVWSKMSTEIDNETFHKAVIMASVLQAETGRPGGVTAENRAELLVDRKKVAGVFYNRIVQEIKWQSDVTATYGINKKICQQTITIPDCLFLDDPLVRNNLYNTYQIDGYPIGPVNNPDIDNIQAALDPIGSNYIFFVMSTDGTVYYGRTDAEHRANIQTATLVNQRNT